MRWSASRSAASSSLRPARRDAGGGGGEREALAPGAGPGRVFAHDRIEPGERGAGEKPGFGLGFRGMDGARPGRERRRRGGRRARDGGRIGAREHAEPYLTAALLASLWAANRRARRRVCMSDNLALSDVVRSMESIPPMAAQNFATDPQIGAAAPHDASPEAAAGAREPAEPTAANRAVDPAPHPAAGARLPGRLQNLAETARDYAQASASENTRKAYGSDWRHFSGWARRHGLPALPPDPQILGLYVAACASGAIAGKPNSVATLERRISALQVEFRAARRNIRPRRPPRRHRPRRRPPHPGHGRPSRKKRSCPRISWR